MSADPRFEIEPQDTAARPRSKWANCLIGCLVVLGIMLVIAIVVGIWVAQRWRGWAADITSQAVNQSVDQSDLPPQEKKEVKDEVARVTTAFGAGQLSVEQVGQIMKGIMESPLMPSLVVMAVEKQYFDKSGLSEEEKTEGRKTLQRFASGLIDEKINQQGMDAVLSHIADRKEGGEWELRQKVSDDDLRAALTEAKKLADEAKIPEEPETFDPSDEIKKIIDKTMIQPAEAAP